jgi:hypothetical protein
MLFSLFRSEHDRERTVNCQGAKGKKATMCAAYSIHVISSTRRCCLLQTEEARPQDIDVDVMQERRQLALSVPGDGFSYAGLRL